MDGIILPPFGSNDVANSGAVFAVVVGDEDVHKFQC
jgi:hypothetical protein